MYCPKCGEQYPDNVSVCGVCHVDLVPFYEQTGPVPNPEYFQKNSWTEIADLLKVFLNSITSWVTGVRMRHKIKNELGRKATNTDLSSINTWIEVEDAETSPQGKKKSLDR